MTTIRNVTEADCGKLEGKNIAPLYEAIKTACPDMAGEALWEKIRNRYQLGFVDCPSWLTKMNAAIAIWNRHLPSDCASIKKVFGV